ncbi:MAG: D-alanyl-D-alanine carboxypeptidase family protein [Acidimicrobiales bacterium]
MSQVLYRRGEPADARTAAPETADWFTGPPEQSQTRWGRRLVVLIVAPFLLFGLLLMVFAAGGAEPQEGAPSAPAVADVPADFLELYQQAGAAYGIDWAVLAGIGKLECDHGRSQLEGCNPPGTVNVAGARGPMQFLGSTWRSGAGQFDPDVAGEPVPAGQEAQGYATDANADGVADPWQAADAIHAAARYLARNGAPADYPGAIWAYNHSDAYRAEVLRWADTYRSAANPVPVAAPGGDVPLATVRGIVVHQSIAGSLDAMLAQAAAEGLMLSGGGYRSHHAQIELRRQHCGTSEYAIYRMPSSQCSPPTARPGASMHEQGLAIDFANCSSRSTRCWQWLDANAAAYGLFNLPSEPWHWSIDGS